MKPRCTKGKYRRIARWEHENVLDTVQDGIEGILAVGLTGSQRATVDAEGRGQGIECRVLAALDDSVDRLVGFSHCVFPVFAFVSNPARPDEPWVARCGGWPERSPRRTGAGRPAAAIQRSELRDCSAEETAA